MMGIRDRDRDAGQRDIALAHTIAALTRAKKLERLSHYLTPHDERPRTMAEKLRAMAERTGARVTVVDRALAA